MERQQFPAGLLGNYYAARHSASHYISCGITSCFSHLAPESHNGPERFVKLLKFALRKTIERHPALCYGVADKSAEAEAHFNRVDAIDWEWVTQFYTWTSIPGEEDATLSTRLEICHQQRFINRYGAPSWRLLVFLHEGTSRVDVSFLNNHAIGDGISGTAFQKTLFENLDLASNQENIEASWPYIVPEDIPRPVFIEDECPFPTTSSPRPAIQPQTNPPPYSFAPFLPLTFRTQISILTIPSNCIPGLLTHCRSQTPPQTLTSLLHSLIVIYLSRVLPLTTISKHTFKACTPYSMRRFSRTPNTEIVNHISYISSLWDSSILSLARSSTDNSSEEAEVIALISAQYTAEIRAELDAVPAFGTQALLAISKIVDWEKELKEAETRDRGYTYEISNIGRVEVPMGKGNEIRLEKLIFTQCGMPAGPPIACSTVSLADGPLCIGFTWQEGVVDATIMAGLKSFLKRRLLTIGA